MLRAFIVLPVLALGLGLAFSGCGEIPIRKSLPDHILRVSIPVFENRSGQPGIENELTRRTVQDCIVLTRDANQVPQQYKLQILVDIDFVDLSDGKETLLWTTRPPFSLTPGVEMTRDDFDSTNTRSLREFTNYYVLNVAGVPPEDEATATERLLDQMSRRIVRRALEGF
jgi:hypothetical protein